MTDKTTATAFSTPRTWRLKELAIESFGGIEKSRDLVLVLPPDKHIIKATGDQGTGKSSFLAAVMSSVGFPLPENMVNLVDKTAKVKVLIEKEGKAYTATASRKGNSSPSYTLSVRDDEGTSKKDSPKEAMLKIVGNVALNPMDLKSMSGEKQIDWIRSLTAFGPEQKELENEILSKRKKYYDERTDVGRRMNECKVSIISTGYYDYDKEQKDFKETPKYLESVAKCGDAPVDAVAMKIRYEEAMTHNKRYQKAVDLVADLNKEKSAQEQAIQELENKLILAKGKLADITNRIEEGNKYLDENKTTPESFAKIEKEFMDYGEVQELRRLTKMADDNVAKYGELSDRYVGLTQNIDESDAIHAKMVADYTPDIEGLEVVIENAIDNPRKEGLYFKGKPLAMLSESELWSLHVRLIDLNNTGIVVIENVSSLGTEAVKILNWFANEKGGYVFLSQMERGQDTLKVEFYEEIK